MEEAAKMIKDYAPWGIKGSRRQRKIQNFLEDEQWSRKALRTPPHNTMELNCVITRQNKLSLLFTLID